MKLVDQFTTFLTDTVDLNATRIDLLEDSIEAVESAVKNSDWAPDILGFEALGSWAHKTIIKPVDGAAFDADLIVYVAPVENWEAKDYVNELHRALSANTLYTDKLRRYSHCVTVEYAGERKIDLTPCVRNRLYPGIDEVCDRNANTFEVSAPRGYTDWLIGRNAKSGSNSFRKVTRLLKFLRDIKSTFTCPSFLLTTLLGQRVLDVDAGSATFADTPTALKTLIGRLDDWLQARPAKPDVRNPVLPTEVQSDAWDDPKYSRFREQINLYRTWIDDAYNETDRAESIGKWRRVFGDEFAAGESTEKAERVSESAMAVVASSAIAKGARDLVDLVYRMGSAALPQGFLALPHMQRPKWRPVAGATIEPRVSATLLSSNGATLRPSVSLEALQRQFKIRFDASQQNGLALPADYEVRWRVTNTDKMARAAHALRGDFYPSEAGNSRTETLAYRGVHMVEAFVIRKRDQRMVGKSPPHMVVVE